MKRARRVLTWFLVAAGLALPMGPAPASAAGLEVDPALAEKLGATAAAAGEAPLRAILSFGEQPSAATLDSLGATGAGLHPFAAFPIVAVEGTPAQIQQALGLPGLVSAYLDKPLRYYLHESVPYIGADQVHAALGYTGKGVGVAILDSGVDGLHPDVAYPARTRQNVKIVSENVKLGKRGAPAQLTMEGLANTDTTSGHGTHVAGIAGGDGTASGGYYAGVAPGADLVGIGTGDLLFILSALEGFDWIAQNAQRYNIRVINCSWGTSGKFSPNDPVNVATRVLHDKYAMAIVFAAGNEGPDPNTLNPYSVAPWVIGVAAGTKDGRLADFSSRGVPGDPLAHPTLTAPGVDIVSARASTGTAINALTATDAALVKPEYLASYTAASGTSMAAPHVAGVAALMLEANPGLSPDAVKGLLVDTASPMFRPDGTPYAAFEVGAGYVNAYEAVRRAAAQAPVAAGAAALPGGGR